MSTPDRVSVEEAQDAWARGLQAPPSPPLADTWPGLAGGLPTHWDEVMAAHTGRPVLAEQDRTHGAGIPAADRGADEKAKYGTSPSAS